MENRITGFPLVFGDVGKSYKIEGIAGDEKTAKHLREIGFFSGATVDLESKTRTGLMIKIGETKLALDAGVCSKIFVTELQKYKDAGMER